MHWNRYLTWRLHRTGFTWLAATLLVILLLPILSGAVAPLNTDFISLRDPASGLSDFAFQRAGIPGEITVRYQRRDQLRSLAAYLNWLRQERSLILPDEPDGGMRRYASYLERVEALHLYRLDEANGLVDQSAWYYGRYAPYWLAIQSGERFSDFFGVGYLTMPFVTDWSPKNDRSFLNEVSWTEFAGSLAESGDPFLIAQSRNLWRQLPLTPQDSASHRLLSLIQYSRFLLVLLPLTAFWILVAIPDRNQRNSRTNLTPRRGLVVFLLSAAALLTMRLVWYASLRLVLGDAAGAMSIVPSWVPDQATGDAAIMSLQSFLLWIMVLDTAFLLFWSAFILLLFQLVRRTDLVVLIAGVTALLPRPLFSLPWTTLDPAAHFSYLHWSLVPRQFDALPGPSVLWGLPSMPFAQLPQDQLVSFLGLTVSFILLTGLVQWIRPRLAFKRPVPVSAGGGLKAKEPENP